jgi:hypothetical protein
MAYEYGVNLKLDSAKALKDIDALLAKLKEVEKTAGKVKLKVSATNDIDKQQRAALKSIQKMQAEEEKLAVKRQLNEQKIAQAQNKTATQQRVNAQKVAQAEEKTSNQRIKNAQKAAREEQKANAEAMKGASEVQRANERLKQEKQRTAQESIRTARQEEQLAQQTLRTKQQEIALLQKILRLKQQAESQQQKSNLTTTIGNGLISAGGALTNIGRLGYNVTNSLREVQSTASRFVNTMLNYAERVGNQLLSYAENIASSALEQYKILETAEIGFGNFFSGDPKEFVRELRKHAEDMPGVGAQDLVQGVQYVAPQAGGNSALALAGAEGVMKAILYSGNSPSQWGANALQNIQQIASGAFTYQDIKQMLRAMPTITKLLAETEHGKELLDNGAITTEKMKAYVKKYGESALLQLFAEIGEKSSAADIYNKYAETFAGVTEHAAEVMKNAWNDAMEKNNVYKTIQNFITRISDSGILNKVFDKLGDAIGNVFDWLQRNETRITSLLKDAMGFLKEIGQTVGSVVSDLAKYLGILNGDGTINNEGLRKVLRQVTDFIKGIIKGFGEGLKTLGDIIKWVAEHLGTDGWEKLGHILGLIASPLGKVVLMFGSLFSAVTQIAGNMMTMFGGSLKNGGLAGTAFSAAGAAYSKATVGAEVGAFATKMKGATAALTTFIGKAMKAVAVGGIIWSVTQAAGELTKSLKIFGDKSDEVGDIVKHVGEVASFTITGAMIGGVAGGVVGCLLALGKAAIDAANELHEIDKQHAEELRDKADIQVYNTIMKMLANKGVNTDTGTEEGYYAAEKLKQKIKASNGNYNYQALADEFANALRFKKTAEALVTFTGTDAFKNAGGAALDLDKNTAERDKIAEMVKWFRLLGDSYDYNVSSERVVKDYLDSGGYSTITDKQYQALIDKWKELDGSIGDETTELSKNIDSTDENTKALQGLKGAVEVVDSTIKGLNLGSPLGSMGNLFNGGYKTIQDAATGTQLDGKAISKDDIKNFLKEQAVSKANSGDKETAAQLLVDLHFADDLNNTELLSRLSQSYPWFIEEFKKYLEQHKAMGGLISPIYRASGGLSQGIDTVPAMLSPGEYVVKRSAVAKAGLGVLNALNHGDLGAAARSIGSRFTNSWNNSRSYASTVNNNQKTVTNNVTVNNRTRGGSLNSYWSLANRMAASF